MKHIYVGLATTLISLLAFAVWAVLGLLVGPRWATIVLLFTAGVGVTVGLVDHATERSPE